MNNILKENATELYEFIIVITSWVLFMFFLAKLYLYILYIEFKKKKNYMRNTYFEQINTLLKIYIYIVQRRAKIFSS